jgi:hypothetical protein
VGDRSEEIGKEGGGQMLRGFALGFAIALAACATPDPSPITLPTDTERAAARRAGFELGAVRSAAELLSATDRDGPNHRVHDAVPNDGTANLYTIESDFGIFRARGDEQLKTRIREIHALAALDAMSGTAEFAKAAGLALASPFVATWNLVSHPVDSIRGVPKNAWDAIRNTAQLAQSDRSEFEDSGLASFVGFETHKRRIAAELDVDPYSANPVLQRELNRFAWAAYAGSLPSMFVPFGPDSAPPESEQRVDGFLLEYSPEDLGRLNRIELAVMGISQDLARSLIDHRWYSPRAETVLVDALAGLDLAANRTAFVALAVRAETERDAGAFVQMARLLRHYNDRVSPLREIIAVDGTPMAHADDGARVLPLPADYAAWTPEMAALCQTATAANPVEAVTPVEHTALVVSGGVTPLARARLDELGIAVTEDVLNPLVAAPAGRE